MMNIDQGTVFYGLRSNKYPEIPCYAIIISARCDIAQNKISKLYYLSALDAHDWFCTSHGFRCTFGQLITEARKNLEKSVTGFGINVDLLESFDKDSVMTILNTNMSGKDLQKAQDNYSKLYDLLGASVDYSSRRRLIHDLEDKKKENIVSAFLSDISSGKTHHYHFIPRLAYTESPDKTSGLIVDLQEIGIMSIDEAKAIYSPGIDNQTLETETTWMVKAGISQKYLREKYWLETENDFVFEEGQLKSPWCELLLQRFALDFIRIGVDGSTKSDYISLAHSIGKEK